MRFWFSFFLFIVLTVSSPQAFIFEDDESMTKAQVAGDNLKHDVPVGKILAKYNNQLVDYCSAVAFGKPGENATRTILSSAHIYTDTKERYSELDFYFQDSCENLLPIQEIRSYCNKPTNANEDLAMFYLTNPTPCNPHMRLANTVEKKETFTCLSYGLALTTSDEFKINNIRADQPYSIVNTYYSPTGNYSSLLTANRFMNISITNGNSRSTFIATPKSDTQIFLHDSGSPWFIGDNINGYTLHALTCSTTPVSSDVFDEKGNTRGHIDFMGMGDSSMTIDIYSLPTNRSFHNCLTALAPARSWIEEFCRGQ